MAVELLRSRLPYPWNYGVTEDGRIFFINDESKSTTWLHPVYNHPIQSGHLSRQDLPKGWELAFTPEGVPYYVDHTNLRTSFIHPLTGQSALPVHEGREPGENYGVDNRNFKRSSLRRSSKKQKVIDKAPEPKRSEDAPVALKGWLYKQDSGGLKSWKKRWFVLSDFCLYYYKDPSESQFQGSILLPSYEIGFCNKNDGVNKRYSFKAEHQNMRTYYFATDNSEDQSRWMSVLKLATQLKNHPAGELKENSFQSSQYSPTEGQGHDDTYTPDSGGFNESRGPPLALGQQSPRSGDTALRSSADDPDWYKNNPEPVENQKTTPETMNRQDEYGYGGDLGMRPGQGMRNTYVTHEPAFPDPRPQYNDSDEGPPIRRPDPNNSNYVNQYQDSYRVMDRESISSLGSRGILPRDHNYNVPKGPYPGQPLENNVYNLQQDPNALEQSTDSVERTLDRSFDSVEVLPGYDSFAENHLQPSGQYLQLDQQPQPADSSAPISRNSSVVEVQRQNSLLRLQQWTRNQQNSAQRHHSSNYSNSSGQPVSDGIRKYGQENVRRQPEEQHRSPNGYASSHRSPPNLNLNPDPEVKQPGPVALSSPENNDQPARPPIPAEYREQYIRELAETKTPHTRNDLLTSIEIQKMKQQQPLVFQYPEERLQYEQMQQREGRQTGREPSAEVIERRLQNSLDPSKSWDDLNDLDQDDAQFKYNSRIDLLLAEKRRIMGETADILKNVQPSSHSEESRNLSRDDDFNSKGHVSSPYETFGQGGSTTKSEYVRPVRRSLEPVFKGSRGDNVYENMTAYHDLAATSRDKLWPNQKSAADENPRTASFRSQTTTPNVSQSVENLGNSLPNHRGQPQGFNQSPQRDTHYGKMPLVCDNPDQPRYHSEGLSQSLGKLHIDVGEWSEGGQVLPRGGGGGRAGVNQRPLNPTWPQKEPLLGKITLNSGNATEEDRDGVQNVGGGVYQDGQQPVVEFSRRDIETIKEDPNMSDQDIFTTKTLADLQRHLSGHRLRLSISAGDLMGKSHEELVLLLIQLRRDQSRLERARDYYRSKLDVHRPQEKDYKLKRKNSIGRLHDVIEKEHDQYVEIRKIYDELENQLEVSKPLVNLLDNMVRMGSLYGGDNLMLASQYKQHKLQPGEYTPPKKMITFSRQYQEQKLSQLQEAELKQLMEDEVDLEEKLQQLYQLDRELQEKSLTVTNLQENKDLLENTMSQLRKDLQMTSDTRMMQNIKYQLRHIEAELVAVRQQLAESSKLLEETSAEDARVENEVMLLRKKIYGLNRTHSTPSLTNDSIRAKQKLEQELEGVQNVMNNLSKQGAVLSDTIKALRHSTPDLTVSNDATRSEKPYMETDMDTGKSHDLGKQAPLVEREINYTKSPYIVEKKEEYIYASVNKARRRGEDWDGCDRSKSEPPVIGRNNEWQHGIEATEVKTRIETTRSSIHQQELPSRNSSINQGSYQRMSGYSEDGMRGMVGESVEEVQSKNRSDYQETRKPFRYNGNQDRELRNGVYRAEMKVVTPEITDYRGYPYVDVESHESRGDGSRDGSQQPLHGYSNQDHNRQVYGQTWMSHEQHTSTKPMSEVHPQQQQPQQEQPQQLYQHKQHGQDTQQILFDKEMYDASPSVGDQVYEPIELSQADENTKKFFGILPKDAARSQTVREVKKEAERRSRERKRFYVNVHGSLDLQQAEMMSEEFQRSRSLPHKTSAPSLLTPSGHSQDDSTLLRRKSVGVYKPKQQVKPERHLSATDRLFPKQSPDITSINPNSRDSVRRMSDIFSPRPFSSNTVNQTSSKSFINSQSHQGNSATVATVRPVVSEKDYQSVDQMEGSKKSWSTENLTKNDPTVREYWNDRLKNRHNPRGRFMTISSTEPIRMETGSRHGWKPSKHQTAAGDLISGHWHDVPDYVRSEPLKDFHFDSETIEREVLYVPEKVEIPDRYVPDSDEEETQEDRERRLVKGEKIKRMLAAQSLAEWRQEEVGFRPRSGPIHKQVEAERKRREHILDLKQALAVQVTQRSKQVAGSGKPTQPSHHDDTPNTQYYGSSQTHNSQSSKRSYSSPFLNHARPFTAQSFGGLY